MDFSQNTRKEMRTLVAAILAAVTAVVFWQAGGLPFIQYDDNLYVMGNGMVQRGLTGEGIAWAFTTTHASNWHPLTWISHMLDVQLLGMDPGRHHLVNVIFHILSAVLLFLVLEGMTGRLWESGFAAALFAIHPLHVQSVAWVAERKDVLSTFFMVLTIGAYHRYCRDPKTGGYLKVMLFFALGLLSKPMLVTLPFLLLLLDYWPLNRLDRGLLPLLREKIPMFVLTAISCVATYIAQEGGEAVKSLEYLPFGARLSNALVSCVAYLWKTLFPSSLSVIYPHLGIFGGIPAWQVAGSALLIVLVSALAIRYGRKHPCLPVGWFWYLGTLIPVIGLVQVGSQAMADRYTYVPLIGIFVALSFGVPEMLDGVRFRKQALTALGALLIPLAVVSWLQLGLWRSGVTLFTHAVTVTENNWLAWNELGIARISGGDAARALEAFRESLRINPGYAIAWNNLGNVYDETGQPGEALAAYGEAIRLKPGYVDGWFNQGFAYRSLKMYPQAAQSWQEAIRLEPGHAEAWYQLGSTLALLGRSDDMMQVYRQLLRIDPARAARLLNPGQAGP